MNCDLGQGLVKGGPLVNFSEVVVHLPEYLVLRPSASWRFLKISWVGALRHNATKVEDCIQNVSLYPGRPRRQMPQMPRTQLIIFADVSPDETPCHYQQTQEGPVQQRMHHQHQYRWPDSRTESQALWDPLPI